LTNPRDRALFGICLYGATRIREACTLRTADVYNRKGTPRSDLIIRKGNTKGKLSTRTVPVIEELRSLLIDYYPIFRGKVGRARSEQLWKSTNTANDISGFDPKYHNKGVLTAYKASLGYIWA
jgi:integrase